MIVSNQIALPSCGDIMYSNFGDFLPQAQTKPGGQAARGVNTGEEFGVVAPVLRDFVIRARNQFISAREFKRNFVWIQFCEVLWLKHEIDLFVLLRVLK